MKDAEFRAFITNERRRLIQYVRSLVQETAEMDAEDVVHDVLMKLLERPTTSLPFGDLGAFVYRSVKNRVIDRIRARKPMVSLDAEPRGAGPKLSELLEDFAPNAFELLHSEQGKHRLFEALGTLGEVERRVVIAQEFEGVSFRELSVELKMPLNTLLSHKSRAMKKLKQHFASSK